MKKQTALFPGNEDKVGFWLTPPELLAELNAEFHFDYDPCPYPRPAGFDGLKESWGQSNYVNPPFGGKAKWVNKAIEEVALGKTVVFVLPVMRDVLYLVQAKAEFRPLVNVGWQNSERKRGKSDWPTVLAILRPQGATV